VGDGRPEHQGVQHPGELHVHGVLGGAGDTREAVLAGRRTADVPELGTGRPGLRGIVLVDEDEHVLEAPLHLTLRADEAGHQSAACPDARSTARSIFG
jgi:hypothetical protein